MDGSENVIWNDNVSKDGDSSGPSDDIQDENDNFYDDESDDIFLSPCL
jgi:hypothetical protein